MRRNPRRASARRPQIGVVLGAGGVLGAAWMAGALQALQQRLDRRLADVDLLVGTSAGSVLATLLRHGTDVNEIVAHQAGGECDLPGMTELDRDLSGGLPSTPRLRLGSPRLLACAALAPHRIDPWATASALLPTGSARHEPLERMVRTVVEGRPRRGALWLMAMDYLSGQRVAFGRADAPAAELTDAVVASCSIPGWFAPRWIGDRPYVDGGIRSTTSLELLAGHGLDEVYVLAPMASFHTDRPRSPWTLVERQVRAMCTAELAREARAVSASGTRVHAVTPGPEDLAVMGHNVMDPSRRRQVLETALRSAPQILDGLERRHLQHAA